MTTFGGRIRDARKAARMSQAELGRIVGVDQSQISDWENDESEPKVSQGLRLARAVGLPLDFLADVAIEAPPSGLNEAEQSAVDIVRATGMSKDEAIRRLVFDPGKPQPLSSMRDRRGAAPK